MLAVVAAELFAPTGIGVAVVFVAFVVAAALFVGFVVVLGAGPVTLPDVRHLHITPSGPH